MRPLRPKAPTISPVSRREGNLIRAWGGPGQGYEWPQNEHGIAIDAAGFVWIGGNGDNDGQYLKFTRMGQFVLQIGKSGPQTNSNDVTRLGRAADAEVDPETNEVYIADGYVGQRVRALNDPDMVLGIYGNAGGLSDGPVVGRRTP